MRILGCLLPVTLGLWMAGSPAGAGQGLILTSSAFASGQPIPIQYTCQGKNVSPPLAWSGLPEGTRSLVLIVEDPDAPDPAKPKLVWDHWLLYNLPPETKGLPEAVAAAKLPLGTYQALNSWKKPGWGGPCPPIGRHRYFFKLSALDVVLPVRKALDKKALLALMQGHVLAKAELIGTYEKSSKKK
jgi:Raf kinase inhibitor-like YbhB/YbcL family protein